MGILPTHANNSAAMEFHVVGSPVWGDATERPNAIIFPNHIQHALTTRAVGFSEEQPTTTLYADSTLCQHVTRCPRRCSQRTNGRIRTRYCSFLPSLVTGRTATAGRWRRWRCGSRTRSRRWCGLRCCRCLGSTHVGHVFGGQGFYFSHPYLLCIREFNSTTAAHYR